MPFFEESGIRVEFPDENCFRFADVPAYKSLSGKHLKEMDLGWWDDRTNILWLVELKGEGIFRQEAGPVTIQQCSGAAGAFPTPAGGRMLHDLLVKVVDTLAILAAVWVGAECGNQIGGDILAEVSDFPGEGKVEVVFALDVPKVRRELLMPISERLNTLLAGRLALFGIRRVRVFDVNTPARPQRLQRSRMRIIRAPD